MSFWLPNRSSLRGSRPGELGVLFAGRRHSRTFQVLVCCGFALPGSFGACRTQAQSGRVPQHQAAPPAAAQHAPAPIERRTPTAAPPPASQLRPLQRALPPAVRTGKGVPLAQWMDQHSRLSPTDQQHALEREPGFHDLPKPTQDRMRQRLSELDSMPPEKRQRILARNEAMSQLSPDQRSEVRGAMQQLGALPQDQRRAVARTFHELRELPPEQRSSALNSERYRSQFNEGQRATLDNLLRVEPLMAPMIAPSDRAPR